MKQSKFFTKFVWSLENASENTGFEYYADCGNQISVKVSSLMIYDYEGYKRKQAKIEIFKYGVPVRLLYCNHNVLAYRLEQLGFDVDKLDWQEQQIEMPITSMNELENITYKLTYILVYYNEAEDAYLVEQGNNNEDIEAIVNRVSFGKYKLRYVFFVNEDAASKLLSSKVMKDNAIKPNWYKAAPELERYFSKFTF